MGFVLQTSIDNKAMQGGGGEERKKSIFICVEHVFRLLCARAHTQGKHQVQVRIKFPHSVFRVALPCVPLLLNLVESLLHSGKTTHQEDCSTSITFFVIVLSLHVGNIAGEQNQRVTETTEANWLCTMFCTKSKNDKMERGTGVVFLEFNFSEVPLSEFFRFHFRNSKRK